MMFLLFKLLLATAIVLVGYALYRQLKGSPHKGASNQRGPIDPSQVSEAEYCILDDEEAEGKDRG